MKIAIISDIHGNLAAFKAVWQKIKDYPLILCAGDFTGYYPDINPIIEQLKIKKVKSILGNHDRYLLKGELPKIINESLIKPFKNNLQEISTKNLEYLKRLGNIAELEIDGARIGIFHGSPFSADEYIFPDNPNLAEFEKLPYNYIIIGHTHWPMVKNLSYRQAGIGKLVIINPGSVGQPRDYDNRASFAILDTKTPKVEIKRVKYDVLKTIRRIKELGFNQDLIKVLKRNRKDE